MAWCTCASVYAAGVVLRCEAKQTCQNWKAACLLANVQAQTTHTSMQLLATSAKEAFAPQNAVAGHPPVQCAFFSQSSCKSRVPSLTQRIITALHACHPPLHRPQFFYRPRAQKVSMLSREHIHSCMSHCCLVAYSAMSIRLWLTVENLACGLVNHNCNAAGMCGVLMPPSAAVGRGYDHCCGTQVPNKP